MNDIGDLYEMQKQLDTRIIRDKELEGQDLLPNTVLALQVEIAELANEWRGFKHWSNDREPRYAKKVTCPTCNGKGKLDEDSQFACEDCDHPYGGIKTIHPLLEEYVDCLHFFLSIAHQRSWPESIYVSEDAVEELRENGFDGGITGAILEMQYWLAKSYMESKLLKAVEENFNYSTKEFCFRSAFFIFVALGFVGFGFTWEQITDAYIAKNKINHQRQATGY